MKTVGLLVGRERSFPDALIAEVTRRGEGVSCAYASVAATPAEEAPPYDVLVDRISHEVTCYQPYLKLAALYGTRVINDPFWRITDDKFFNAGLAKVLGVAVPKTVLLPQKHYPSGITGESLARNMQLVDWDALEARLGYPMYMKPHWGGGWHGVSRAWSRAELLHAYDASGTQPMIVQEAINWTQYVRCIVVGESGVLPALWDPRLSHFDRYARAQDEMPALTPALRERVEKDALTISRALGYTMNTVELAIADGVPYAIDYMNSAPDFDLTSLGEEYFAWVVSKMGDLVVRMAHEERRPLRRTPLGRESTV